VTDRPPGPAKSQAIVGEVRRRIDEQEWRQGDRIPDEADLATEFGVARATVNKALQIRRARSDLSQLPSWATTSQCRTRAHIAIALQRQ